jgi:hypothetical protein
MTFSNSTSDADPGAGKIAFNNGTLSSVSVLFVDDADDASADISSFVQSWDDISNEEARGIVTVTKEGTPSTYATFKVSGAVTDASGYTKVPVTHVVSAGSFSNSDGVGVHFSYSGADGSGNVSTDGTQTLTNKTLTSPKIGTSILDTNGNELFKLTATGSAVNEITYNNAATGNKPTFTASGDDTNIGVSIQPKGSGQVTIDNLTFPAADGSADQFLKTDGSGNLSFSAVSGGAISWQSSVQTSNFTADSGKGYFVNTTSGAITVTLPASPSAGDIVAVKDYAKTFDSNNCTLGRNSSKIAGETADAILSTEGIAVTLVFIDSTQGWLVTNSGLTSEAPTTRSVAFKLWGAGGGSASGGTDGGPGGGGGFVAGTYNLSIGTSIVAVVGQGGPGGLSGRGGSGGGYSGVFTSSVAQGNALLIAGGAGGGSRGSTSFGSYGGAGGGTTGGSGQASSGSAATGGTQSAGGTAGSGGSNGNAGSALQGGSNTEHASGGTAFGGGGSGGGDASSFTAGGGGGGYFGGGSGGDSGGGGGSSYVGTATSTTNTQGNITAGSGAGGLTANSSDAQYPGSVGDGGAHTGGSGSNAGENGAIAYQIDGGSWVALSYTGSNQTFTIT